MEQYTVTGWSHRSETSYTFGPFRSVRSMNDFIDKLDTMDGWEFSDVSVLNAPNLLGTGQETSFIS